MKVGKGAQRRSSSRISSSSSSSGGNSNSNSNSDYKVQFLNDVLLNFDNINDSNDSKYTVEELNRIQRGLPPWKSMSFGCGGWLQFYLYGVARALQARGLDCPNDITYAGCSAGALAAAGLIIEGDFDAAVQFCKDKCVPLAHGHWSGLFRIGEYVSECIDLLMKSKYRDIKDDMLQVAITRLPFLTAERKTSFSSFQDLKDALLSSSSAFPAAPLIYREGAWCLDGGITDFQPIVDSETITVSPFYFSDCDIKPSRYVPLWWAFLPPKSNDTVDWVYNLGYEDAMNYFDERNIPYFPTSFPHLLQFNRNKEHPYDTPRRISMHRFLGYDLSNMTGQYISFTMDFLLLLMVVLVWKPLVLLSIYTELVVRALVELASIIIYEVHHAVFLFSLCILLFVLPHIVLHGVVRDIDYTVTSSILILVSIVKLSIQGFSKKNEIQRNNILLCLACIFSLSLVSRFVSGRPSSTTLRKHDKLYKISVLYRIFRHII